MRSECILCRKRHGKAFLPDIDTSGDSDGASGGNDRRFCGSIRQLGGCDRRRSRATLSDRARKELLFVLQQTLQPLVLDADAINLIAKDEALLQELIEHQQNPATRRKLILTPHPGELARLEGCAIEEILKQPVFYAKKWANRLQAAVLCKGARSIAASPDGSIYINRSGNSGMAVAGSGDVLTGIVTALLSTIDDRSGRCVSASICTVWQATWQPIQRANTV